LPGFFEVHVYKVQFRVLRDIHQVRYNRTKFERQAENEPL
jgi:hypothetical protein